MQITWNKWKRESELTKAVRLHYQQEISSLDRLQTLQKMPDLGLNCFFIEKCIPVVFPCEILEKMKEMTDIHAFFSVLKLLGCH